MSDRQKTRILAIYYIYINAGVTVSESMQKLVDRIQNERGKVGLVLSDPERITPVALPKMDHCAGFRFV